MERIDQTNFTDNDEDKISSLPSLADRSTNKVGQGNINKVAGHKPTLAMLEKRRDAVNKEGQISLIVGVIAGLSTIGLLVGAIAAIGLDQPESSLFSLVGALGSVWVASWAGVDFIIASYIEEIIEQNISNLEKNQTQLEAISDPTIPTWNAALHQ